MQKNEDYGQKIGGARKDLYDVNQILEVSAISLKNKTLSTVYKLPDLRKMYLAGQIDATQAREARAVWQMIGRKPARGLADWAVKVDALIHYIHGVLVGDTPIDFRAPALAYEELQAANWPDEDYKPGSLEIRRTYDGIYQVTQGRRYAARCLTIADAVAKVRELAGQKKEMKFQARMFTSTQEVFICPENRHKIIVRRGLKSWNEAREIIQNEYDQLVADYKVMTTISDFRGDSLERRGPDYRAGAPVNVACFANEFRFRGVEFGNWVTQEERADFLGRCYDAFCDLAELLGISRAGLGLKGLGFAFASRGVGRAAAHYEPGRNVINLTKRSGAGCVAHEWFHALDHFAGVRAGLGGYLSEAAPAQRVGRLGEAMTALLQAIRASQYYQRAMKIDELKDKSYWATSLELCARAFEKYIHARLNEAGRASGFLVSIQTDAVSQACELYPYPTDAENAVFAPIFGNFLAAAVELLPADVIDENQAENKACGVEAIAASLEAEGAEVRTAPQEEGQGAPLENQEPDIAGAAYGDPEKSLLSDVSAQPVHGEFPTDLADQRKYFRAVEAFASEIGCRCSFRVECGRKIFANVLAADGQPVALFSYEVKSRHREAYTIQAGKRTRARNWSVAIDALRSALSGQSAPEEVPEVLEHVQPDDTTPAQAGTPSNEGGTLENQHIEAEGAAYGVSKKSLPQAIPYGDSEKSLPTLCMANAHRATLVRRKDEYGTVYEFVWRGKRIEVNWLRADFCHILRHDGEELELDDWRKAMEDYEVVAFAYDENFADMWNLAVRAFEGTSYSPEERAALYIRDYERALQDDLKALPEDDKPDYIAKFRARVSDLFERHSRILSPMITGPARFPSARNAKANNAYDNAVGEFEEWRKKYAKRAAQRVEDAKPQEQKESEEWARVKSDITNTAATIEAIDKGTYCGIRSLFVSGLYGRLSTLANAGKSELITKALNYIREINQSLPKPIFTDRHKVWQLVEVAAASIRAEAERKEAPTAELTFTGGRILKNYAEDRLQILFDGKPDSVTIRNLKKNGFRWSPRYMAWQRQLTDNAYYAAARVLPDVTPDDLRRCRATSAT